MTLLSERNTKTTSVGSKSINTNWRLSTLLISVILENFGEIEEIILQQHNKKDLVIAAAHVMKILAKSEIRTDLFKP